MPWILLTGIDLIPKVLKVLVSMSINEIHPKRMNISWGDPLRPAEWDTVFMTSPMQEWENEEKVFPFSLPPSPCHKRSNFQTGRSFGAMDLPCLAWMLFLMTSSPSYWTRMMRNLHLARPHLLLIDEKSISCIFLPGCQVMVLFLATFIFLY